jgi:hypothetical protein
MTIKKKEIFFIAFGYLGKNANIDKILI